MDVKKETIINFKEPILKAIQLTCEDFEQAGNSTENYNILYRKISNNTTLNAFDYELLKLVIAYQAEKMANQAKRLQEAASTLINIAKILHAKD